MRFLLLGLALALLALSLLTWREIPAWVNWRLAVLAGEYGHGLALVAVGLIAATGFLRPGAAWTFGITLCAAAAAVMLVKPALQASRIANRLPATFPWAPKEGESRARSPFSVARLFTMPPTPIATRTLRFSDGLDLDFYPTPRRAPSPCIVAIHGGGWDSGDRSQLRTFNDTLAHDGYAVAAISYRLAPAQPWPAQAEDVVNALAFLKAHAGELNIDPTRIVLLGRSAGGHIAEMVGYTVRDPSIRGVVALYAPADLEFAWTCRQPDKVLDSPLLMRQLIGAPYESAPAAFRAASGYFHVTADVPPTLLIHGGLDPLVWHRQSERLAVKLTENGVPNAFISLPWATHAFEFNVRGPAGQLTVWAVECFVDGVTQHPPGRAARPSGRMSGGTPVPRTD